MIEIFIVISFIFLIAAELFYIPIARRNSWTSARNNRTDGHPITVIGGGFIFFVSILLYSFGIGWLYEPPQVMANMFVGITMLAACSFLDDILQLKVWIRLVVQFVAVMFLAFQFNLVELPFWMLVIYMICSVGMINGYNFMDGINGITAAYSLSVLGVFLWINLSVEHFTSGLLLVFAIMGVLVFAYFNFRRHAIVFAGDVGAICMGYIVVTILTFYILQEKELSSIIFLIVYIVDVVMTILRRIVEKENIFRPHHKHIYQLLNRQWGCNQLLLAGTYAGLQTVISVGYVYIPQNEKWQFFAIVTSVLVATYLVIVALTSRKERKIEFRQTKEAIEKCPVKSLKSNKS